MLSYDQDNPKDNWSEEQKLWLKANKPKELFDSLIQIGQYGNGFTPKELINIYDEGEKRYAAHLGPGYLDEKKDHNDPTGTQKFGDLILWKESIRHCHSDKRPLLFVTGDIKRDWWEFDENK